MKTILLCLVLLTGSNLLSEQPASFKYDDYCYYRNHLYLNTPSILLNAAGLKDVATDTVAAISFITQAANAGLLDEVHQVHQPVSFISRLGVAGDMPATKPGTQGPFKHCNWCLSTLIAPGDVYQRV